MGRGGELGQFGISEAEEGGGGNKMLRPPVVDYVCPADIFWGLGLGVFCRIICSFCDMFRNSLSNPKVTSIIIKSV